MIVWILFVILILTLLVIDLGVFNKKSEVISGRKAAKFTGFVVSLALLFAGVVYYVFSNGLVDNHQNLSPGDAVLLYITGYLVEISLSMDNVFVISMIFSYFSIPRAYQHKVLFWGILGAIVFRAIMIFLGVVLIEQFSWMIYVFGLVLLYSAYKMWKTDEEQQDLSNNTIIRLVKKFFPVTKSLHEDSFFVRKRGVLAATPLFVVLVIIEFTDIVFAVDSIPAIIGITTNSFIVFSSNIFAIVGLRSMYFLLDSLMEKFHYLKYSLVFVLGFVGLKMLLVEVVHLPVWVSLGVIVVSLSLGLAYSLLRKDT